MTVTGLYARFPSVSLTSQADFAEFRRAMQDRLDARYSYETGLVTRDDRLIHPGTCAPCLRRARFTSDTTRWERLPDGRRVPRWEDSLICDCARRLGNRARAVLHFATAVAGLESGTRLLLFGPTHGSYHSLAKLSGETIAIPALRHGAGHDDYRLDLSDSVCDLAIAVECLHRVPPLDAALAELRRVLVPGGSLLLTIPFRYESSRTTSRRDLPQPAPAMLQEAAHEIGWDILDRLRDVGFSEAAAHCYWSAELGYLGPFNMIFHASV
jgi:SAM-dependent methyltransferase